MFDWDFEEIIGAVIVAAIILFVATLFFSPKNVDYYYVSSGGNEKVCVFAHWTWHVDEQAFCTPDSNKALEFTARANELLKK